MVLANAIFSTNSSTPLWWAGRRFQMSHAVARSPRSLVGIAQSCLKEPFYSSSFFTRLCEKQRALLDRVRCEQVLISRCGVKGLD